MGASLLRHRDSPKPLAELVAEDCQLLLREVDEHVGHWTRRVLLEEPGEDARIDASVFFESEREVPFWWEPSSIEKEQVHEIAGLGA